MRGRVSHCTLMSVSVGDLFSGRRATGARARCLVGEWRTSRGGGVAYFARGSSLPGWVILAGTSAPQYHRITRDDTFNPSRLLSLALVLAEDRSVTLSDAAVEIARAARYDETTIARAVRIGLTYFGHQGTDANDTAITALAILERAQSLPVRH